ASLNYRIRGLGDLLFMHLAFPDQPDRAEAQARKSSISFREHRRILESLLGKKEELGPLLDQLIDTYGLDRYDVVGFTSMFVQNVPSIAMARRLKQRRPEIVTLLGGANCETPMGQVIAKNVESIDFVFSGPGLVSFPQLIGHLLAGEEERCHGLTGVFSAERLRREGKIHEIGRELPIDEDVPLDFDDFLASLDAKGLDGIQPVLTFETSRGCWWGERAHCTFCGLNGMTMKYRAMEPAKALALIRGLYDRYYPRVKRLQSVDNIMPRSYLEEVFPKLETPEGARIFYEVKADLKDHEMETLARSGVTLLQPGIEALSTPVLKLMRKGTTALQNIRFLKSCLAYGIEPTWNLLIGFPGEEEHVYEKYME
ncbi:MAG: RiPP maturation radical SAM C-methyltransferase, partial [Holophagales bacterium]|nr:RiPP maturation radical SAM C-methyltransferase [Holophagales bacterium]